MRLDTQNARRTGHPVLGLEKRGHRRSATAGYNRIRKRLLERARSFWIALRGILAGRPSTMESIRLPNAAWLLKAPNLRGGGRGWQTPSISPAIAWRQGRRARRCNG